jgi:phosphoribosylanthranilate isomerase
MTQTFNRVRIKMCGMTRKDDIAHAASIGVDAIGLVFYEKSTRYVSIEKATLLLQDLPAFVDVVAVFVNAEIPFVTRVMSQLPIQLLQFHGDESPAFCEQFCKPYIKAIPATSAEAIIAVAKQHQHAAAVLVDTPSTHHGGTGQTFDWQVVPRQLPKPFILAGGLDAHNVASALDACSPYAIDVCSGIEASAGIKDHYKMNSFVNVLRGKE